MQNGSHCEKKGSSKLYERISISSENQTDNKHWMFSI